MNDKKGKIYISPNWAWKAIMKSPEKFGDFPVILVEHPKNKNKIAYQLLYK